jgi:hypothetical protein
VNLNVLALEICDRRDEKSPRQFSIENGELALRNMDECSGQHQSVTPESQPHAAIRIAEAFASSTPDQAFPAGEV